MTYSIFTKSALVLCSALLVSACDQNSGGSANPKLSKNSNISGNNGSQPYGLKTSKNDWPSLEGGSVGIADNIQASNYYIVFDGSGSMNDRECSDGQSKLPVAKEAVANFVESIPSDANIGLFTFDRNSTSERVSLGINKQTEVVASVKNTYADGGTPLAAAVNNGYRALLKQAKMQLGYGEYHLVIITDGRASTGQDPEKYVNKIIETSPVVIHTVGFCIDDNHSLNQPGRTNYKSANNPTSLRKSLDSILAESPDFNVNSFN